MSNYSDDQEIRRYYLLAASFLSSYGLESSYRLPTRILLDEVKDFLFLILQMDKLRNRDIQYNLPKTAGLVSDVRQKSTSLWFYFPYPLCY